MKIKDKDLQYKDLMPLQHTWCSLSWKSNSLSLHFSTTYAWAAEVWPPTRIAVELHLSSHSACLVGNMQLCPLSLFWTLFALPAACGVLPSPLPCHLDGFILGSFFNCSSSALATAVTSSQLMLHACDGLVYTPVCQPLLSSYCLVRDHQNSHLWLSVSQPLSHDHSHSGQDFHHCFRKFSSLIKKRSILLPTPACGYMLTDCQVLFWQLCFWNALPESMLSPSYLNC